MPKQKHPSPPDLVALLDELKRDMLARMFCAQIGVIQAFDPASQTATVKIAIKQIKDIDDNGVKTLAEYPLILECPVLFPHGGGFSLTFPVSQGDECLLVFADRGIDNWLRSGDGQQPSTPRAHDISDAVAIVGVRSNPNALAGFSAASAQLRSDDGEVYVDVSGDEIQLHAPNVKVHAGVSYAWDCNGYGARLTWTGSTNWTQDTYYTGATVTTITHSINPPEIP